jgi:SAM-dependent methyltransferase
MKTLREVWDRYALKWVTEWGGREMQNWQIEERNRFANRFSRGSLILDLGCGMGRDLRIFDQFGLRCLGLDFSKQMLSIHGFKDCVCASMNRLPFKKETFDGVWSCSSMKYLAYEELLETLKEVRRVLKFDGLCWIGLDEGEGEVTEKRDDIDLTLHLHSGNHFSSFLEELGVKILEKQHIKAWRDFLNFLVVKI